MSRRLRARVAIGALLATSAARADVPADGFVLAGQSNMVGGSTQNQDDKTGNVTSPDPAGLSSFSYRSGDRRWVLANEFPCDDSQCTGTSCTYRGPTRSCAIHPQWIDTGYGTCVCRCGVHIPASNTNADVGRASAWPTFAARWMSERGRAVEFVATAIGGQALVASYGIQPTWDPDAMDCSTLVPIPPGGAQPSLTAPGELYCRMVETVRQANPQKLRAVLWQQGEADVWLVTGDQYEAGLERLADRVWEDLGVPLVVAPLSAKTRTDDACTIGPRDEQIRDAQLRAIDRHPRILRGPSLDDLSFEADCTHIHDVVEMGHRWYDAVAATDAACNDGIDDDGDGLVDYPEDPGCASEFSTTESPQCQDGVDNDLDGGIDFDGGASANGGVALGPPDPSCGRLSAPNESLPSCGVGSGLPLALLLLFARRRHASSSLRA